MLKFSLFNSIKSTYSIITRGISNFRISIGPVIRSEHNGKSEQYISAFSTDPTSNSLERYNNYLASNNIDKGVVDYSAIMNKHYLKIPVEKNKDISFIASHHNQDIDSITSKMKKPPL